MDTLPLRIDPGEDDKLACTDRAVWEKRWAAMKRDHNSVATSHFQLPWVLGTPDMESAMEKLRKFTLAGVAEKITCPLLICDWLSKRML